MIETESLHHAIKQSIKQIRSSSLLVSKMLHNKILLEEIYIEDIHYALLRTKGWSVSKTAIMRCIRNNSEDKDYKKILKKYKKKSVNFNI